MSPEHISIVMPEKRTSHLVFPFSFLVLYNPPHCLSLFMRRSPDPRPYLSRPWAHPFAASLSREVAQQTAARFRAASRSPSFGAAARHLQHGLRIPRFILIGGDAGIGFQRLVHNVFPRNSSAPGRTAPRAPHFSRVPPGLIRPFLRSAHNGRAFCKSVRASAYSLARMHNVPRPARHRASTAVGKSLHVLQIGPAGSAYCAGLSAACASFSSDCPRQ